MTHLPPRLLGLGLAASLACSTPPAPLAPIQETPSRAAATTAVRACLPLLQQSAYQWFEKRSCVSCHHHSLGLTSVTLAAERGFAIDEELRTEQIELGLARELDDVEGVLQNDINEAGINAQLGLGYKLLGLAAGQVPADAHTDARARLLLDKQGPEGRWRSSSHRPPLEDCEMTATALAARALQLYAPPGNAERVTQATALARGWLSRAEASSNEERAMRLFGLAWTGADGELLQAAARDLLEQQREDGGWAQIATRASDAYATGESLVALHQAAGLSVQDSRFQRGVAWLLREQLPDGSWRVDTRRRGEGLPYFETGFPHGEDQFISFTASAWASMALTCAAQPGPSPIFVGCAPLPRAASPPALPPLVQAALFGELAELRALLDAGVDVDQAGEHGLSALMGSVHDCDKLALLLERGARVEARSEFGCSALILAAGTHGGECATRLLLQHGADLHVRAKDGSNALSRAVESGNCELVAELLDAGAPLDAPSTENLSALHLAVWQADAAMVRTLLAHGADPDGLALSGSSGEIDAPLIPAAMDGSSEVVELLLEAGADADALDGQGRSALAWAAIVDWGNDRSLRSLLEHGASPHCIDQDGQSVLDHARRTGKASAIALLERSAQPAR